MAVVVACAVAFSYAVYCAAGQWGPFKVWLWVAGICAALFGVGVVERDAWPLGLMMDEGAVLLFGLGTVVSAVAGTVKYPAGSARVGDEAGVDTDIVLYDRDGS